MTVLLAQAQPAPSSNAATPAPMPQQTFTIQVPERQTLSVVSQEPLKLQVVDDGFPWALVLPFVGVLAGVAGLWLTTHLTIRNAQRTTTDQLNHASKEAAEERRNQRLAALTADFVAASRNVHALTARMHERTLAEVINSPEQVAYNTAVDLLVVWLDGEAAVLMHKLQTMTMEHHLMGIEKARKSREGTAHLNGLQQEEAVARDVLSNLLHQRIQLAQHANDPAVRDRYDILGRQVVEATNNFAKVSAQIQQTKGELAQVKLAFSEWNLEMQKAYGDLPVRVMIAIRRNLGQPPIDKELIDANNERIAAVERVYESIKAAIAADQEMVREATPAEAARYDQGAPQSTSPEARG